MGAIRLHKIVEKDGEISLTGLPYRRGQCVEVIVLPESSVTSTKRYLTASRLLCSELIGVWKDRKDIGDSADYARQLREQAQRRRW
jgi:hypothetical protein